MDLGHEEHQVQCDFILPKDSKDIGHRALQHMVMESQVAQTCSGPLAAHENSLLWVNHVL